MYIEKKYHKIWLRGRDRYIEEKRCRWVFEKIGLLVIDSSFFWEIKIWKSVINSGMGLKKLSLNVDELRRKWSKEASERARKYKPVLPIDGFGECGLSDAMLGWRDGTRTDILDPRLSWLCISLLSRRSDTFIRRGFGVLNIVRLSCQRALQTKRNESKYNYHCLNCDTFIWKWSDLNCTYSHWLQIMMKFATVSRSEYLIVRVREPDISMRSAHSEYMYRWWYVWVKLFVQQTFTHFPTKYIRTHV